MKLVPRDSSFDIPIHIYIHQLAETYVHVQYVMVIVINFIHK